MFVGTCRIIPSHRLAGVAGQPWFCDTDNNFWTVTMLDLPLVKQSHGAILKYPLLKTSILLGEINLRVAGASS